MLRAKRATEVHCKGIAKWDRGELCPGAMPAATPLSDQESFLYFTVATSLPLILVVNKKTTNYSAVQVYVRGRVVGVVFSSSIVTIDRQRVLYLDKHRADK